MRFRERGGFGGGNDIFAREVLLLVRDIAQVEVI